MNIGNPCRCRASPQRHFAFSASKGASGGGNRSHRGVSFSSWCNSFIVSVSYHRKRIRRFWGQLCFCVKAESPILEQRVVFIFSKMVFIQSKDYCQRGALEAPVPIIDVVLTVQSIIPCDIFRVIVPCVQVFQQSRFFFRNSFRYDNLIQTSIRPWEPITPTMRLPQMNC